MGKEIENMQTHRDFWRRSGNVSILDFAVVLPTHLCIILSLLMIISHLPPSHTYEDLAFRSMRNKSALYYQSGRESNSGGSGKKDAALQKDCSSLEHARFKVPSYSDFTWEEKVGGFGQNQKPKEIYINKYYGVYRDRIFIRNSGSSLDFKLQLDNQASDPRITARGWREEYLLSHGTFHWETRNLTVRKPDGTTIFNTNATAPPLEMELVHYAKRFGSLEEAALEPSGLLITVHMFELVGRDSPDLEPLARSVLSTAFPTQNFKQVHGPLDIKSLFPSELSYYEFKGLYPLKPCALEARYVVFKRPLFVSARQLKRFAALRSEDGKKIVDKLANDPASSDVAQVSFGGTAENRDDDRPTYLVVVPLRSLAHLSAVDCLRYCFLWIILGQFLVLWLYMIL